MKEIPLTRGLFALVDDEDFDWLNQWNWAAVRDRSQKIDTFYAKRAGSKNDLVKEQRMSRLLMRAPSGVKVDHKNGDSLDNQKSNLRLASSRQNSQNARKWSKPTSSQYKGVSYRKNGGKWVARAWCPETRVRKSLGYFTTETEAALQYDQEVRKMFGEFACLNFPKEGERGARSGAVERGGDASKEPKLLRKQKSNVSSRYVGVTYFSRDKGWRAFLGASQGVPRQYLGLFKSEDVAGVAYDEALRQTGRPHPCFNFPRPGERSVLTGLIVPDQVSLAE